MADRIRSRRGSVRLPRVAGPDGAVRSRSEERLAALERARHPAQRGHELAVELDDLTGDARPAEAAGPLDGPEAQAVSPALVPEQGPDRAGERLDIPLWGEEAGDVVLDWVGQAAPARRDDGR